MSIRKNNIKTTPDWLPIKIIKISSIFELHAKKIIIIYTIIARIRDPLILKSKHSRRTRSIAIATMNRIPPSVMITDTNGIS
jgi:hypothetical protein